MQFRFKAKTELAGIGLLSFPSQFGASVEIVIDGFLEGGAQLFDRLAVKAHHIPNTGDTANEKRPSSLYSIRAA